HSVLAVGPGWDWTTMSTLYDDISVYTTQLRALENFVREHPQDGAARFVLGYHYMTGGHADAARREFEQVMKLVSNDRVASDLFRMLSPPKEAQAATPGGEEPRPQPPPESPSEAPPINPVNPNQLLGSWRASREDGSKFELTLNKDGTFDWKFARPKEKAVEFGGKYTVEQNVLALER